MCKHINIYINTIQAGLYCKIEMIRLKLLKKGLK